MTGSGALAAGWLLLLVTAAGAAIGTFLGGQVDLRFLGGLAGGALGIGLGFLLVYRIYVVPANEATRNRDYSGITPLEDEDDDDDSW